MISLIAAVARNGAIGKNNQLLWHLPEDMRYFRETTRGKPVIMGRRTWESLPDAFRPLPGRRNVVVSRNTTFQAPGATLVGSLNEAIQLTEDTADEVFIIGGAELYRQALPAVQRLYLTEIASDFDGDVFFPPIQANDWTEISRSAAQSASGLEFSFVVYQRTQST